MKVYTISESQMNLFLGSVRTLLTVATEVFKEHYNNSGFNTKPFEQTPDGYLVNNVESQLTRLEELEPGNIEYSIDDVKADLLKQGQVAVIWSTDDIDNALETHNRDEENPETMTYEEKVELLEDIFGYNADHTNDNETIYYRLIDFLNDREK